MQILFDTTPELTALLVPSSHVHIMAKVSKASRRALARAPCCVPLRLRGAGGDAAAFLAATFPAAASIALAVQSAGPAQLAAAGAQIAALSDAQARRVSALSVCMAPTFAQDLSALHRGVFPRAALGGLASLRLDGTPYTHELLLGGEAAALPAGLREFSWEFGRIYKSGAERLLSRVLSGLPELAAVSLAHNYIEDVDAVFDELYFPVLECLDLSHNCYYRYELATLARTAARTRLLPALRELDASGCPKLLNCTAWNSTQDFAVMLGDVLAVLAGFPLLRTLRLAGYSPLFAVLFARHDARLRFV